MRPSSNGGGGGERGAGACSLRKDGGGSGVGRSEGASTEEGEAASGCVCGERECAKTSTLRCEKEEQTSMGDGGGDGGDKNQW